VRPTTTNHLTVEELRAQAKKLGLTGYSKLRKDELLKLLAAHGLPPDEERSATAKAAPRTETVQTKVSNAHPADSRDAALARPRPPLGAAAKSAAAEITASEAEQQVESAKYAFAPPGVSVPQPAAAPDLGEDIERLPAIEEPLLCLLPQKPGILHGYWVIPPGAQLAGQALRLRLAQFAGENIEVLEEMPLPGARGHWYFHLHNETDHGAVYLQLGYYTADGRFVTAFYRGIARIPSLYASARTDRLWWVSDEQFRAMYLRAGGFARGPRLGWAAAGSSPGAPPPPGERLAWPGGISSQR
jgi:hypothetical protein